MIVGQITKTLLWFNLNGIFKKSNVVNGAVQPLQNYKLSLVFNSFNYFFGFLA